MKKKIDHSKCIINLAILCYVLYVIIVIVIILYDCVIMHYEGIYNALYMSEKER